MQGGEKGGGKGAGGLQDYNSKIVLSLVNISCAARRTIPRQISRPLCFVAVVTLNCRAGSTIALGV